MPRRFIEKNEFRLSDRWKQFSARFIRKKGRKCEICGSTTSAVYNVHHKYKDDYENLSTNRFMCLCRECHRFCHQKQKYLPTIAKNLKKFKWE